MKSNNQLIYNMILILGDFLALVFAFSMAYIFRVTLDHRAFSVVIHAKTYLIIFLSLMPFWILIFALFNLYSERILEKRFNEMMRLILASLIGILFVISFSYLFDVAIFPAKIVVLYGLLLALFFVFLFRTLARIVRQQLFKYNVGITNIVIVGNNQAANEIAHYVSNTSKTGYKIIAMIGLNNKKYYPYFSSFSSFIKSDLKNEVSTIIQTELFLDNQKNDEILTFCQENHVSYRFIPGNNELFIGNITVDLFHSMPIVAVHQTPLIGWGRIIKRLFDIAGSIILIILSSPFMLVVLIILMLDHGDPIFSQIRLSRFGQKIKIYKFRTYYHQYHRMSPEKGFKKMGREDLAILYRSNGDYLENDPRISKIGRFLRHTSLDELPQLFNVLKGDLSLVGPRPLEPFELNKYGKKNLILSVKSGLTGLAVISGRRNIPYEERRKLDVYYVQHWSFLYDIIILIKTIKIIFNRNGAK